MISHLSNASKIVLLDLFNKICEEGELPNSWKEAIIVLIRKPGKDSSNPVNYRPIALTSHVFKLMEKMIKERLLYFIETRGLISNYQSGFKKGRCTMDPAVCLEHETRKAQINKESVVAVFFDIEKAYDMMWKEGLIIKLNKLGIKGNMLKWLKSFLNDRSIQVRIGKNYSRSCFVENGTPQGSIISPLLFSIMIDDIFVGVDGGMGFSLFADDGAVWKRGRNVAFIVKKKKNYRKLFIKLKNGLSNGVFDFLLIKLRLYFLQEGKLMITLK
ncbi:hypothetical protein LDENG_00131950 [Lucifuga dentata]|nr:hypothetical protein LDENG_00131950 [Lucifuga dentata]